MRVLVVEDEVMLADTIAEGLRERGFAVDVVYDGEAALERCAVNDYDVAVLDRDLPLVHGDEVCRTLVSGPATTRILLLTAASGVPDRVAGLELGADDYLPKPFAFTELTDSMLERLERSFDGQRRFIANASHELRTPLTTTRALVEVAATASGSSEDTRRLGGKLLTITTAQERLLDSLLALAHSETTIDRGTRIDLADLAAEAASAHAAAARRAGIELRTELAAAPLHGDPALLSRVVHNLVDNAIRYNLPTGGWITCTARQPARTPRPCRSPTPDPSSTPTTQPPCSSRSAGFATTAPTSHAAPASDCPSYAPWYEHTTAACRPAPAATAA